MASLTHKGNVSLIFYLKQLILISRSEGGKKRKEEEEDLEELCLSILFLNLLLTLIS